MVEGECLRYYRGCVHFVFIRISKSDFDKAEKRLFKKQSPGAANVTFQHLAFCTIVC